MPLPMLTDADIPSHFILASNLADILDKCYMSLLHSHLGHLCTPPVSIYLIPHLQSSAPNP
jgi:hypothetical protein